MQQINAKILKEIRKAPELSSAQTIEANKEEIKITFEAGHQRTGKELLTLQKILFNNEIFSFIKNEKASLFDNELKYVRVIFY